MVEYECEDCDYMEAIHNGDYTKNQEKYKKCQNCSKRAQNYLKFIEKRGL